MCLSYRQQHRLRLVGTGLRRSDPLLCAMFDMFGRLYRGEGMPAWEQVPTRPDRGRIAAWSVAVLAAMAAVLTTALIAVIAMRRPRRCPQASVPERAPYGREAGDYQGLGGHS